MFLSVAARSGLIKRVLAQPSLANVAVVSVRNKTYTNTPIEDHLKNWETANAKYFGPERDHVNFPHHSQPLTSPPVRLGWIPESWFTILHDKLGVTGPYTLGVGVFAFLISKELWVFEEHFAEFVGFCMAAMIIQKKLGHNIAGFFDKKVESYNDAAFVKPIADAKSAATVAISDAETRIAQMAGVKYIYEAKRENIALQLEEIYRKRLLDVHDAVKSRLDYQVALQDSQRNLQKEFMVKWIVDSVYSNITKEQEDEALQKCLSDLKQLTA